MLNQYGFALDQQHVMDNTLGVLRSAADPMITSSFRLNLPSTLLAGGQTRVTRNDVSTLYASAGRIGQLDSGQLQGFDLMAGQQYALGYSRKLGNKWRAGAHLVSVSGSEDTRDHQSVATAFQYLDSKTRARYIAHTLVDSKGQYGLWADGENRINDWRYRYGLFRLGPGLLWTDSTPANDQQGGYVRTEIHRLRYNMTAGLEVFQTDIDKQPEIAGVDIFNSFLNGTWRLARKTSIGGTLSLRNNSARDVLSDDSHAYRLSGFVTHAFPIGASRLQLQTSELEQAGNNGNAYEITWDQDWELLRALSVSTSLSHETENEVDESKGRSEASLLLLHNVSPGLSWSGDFSYTALDTSSGDKQNNINASLAFGWNFVPHWDVSARATYNMLDGDIEGIGTTDLEDEKTLLLNLRYGKNSGRPFTRIGNGTDSKGYGRLAGRVFFDDNSDGRRQAGERVASGVYVYLDDRYQAITDGDGNYKFESVSSGKHAMTLAEEDLPLPWGLLDESVKQVQVDVRKTATLDFGLQQITE